MLGSCLVLHCVFEVAAKFSAILPQLAPVALELLHILGQLDFVACYFLTILTDLLQVLSNLRLAGAVFDVAMQLLPVADQLFAVSVEFFSVAVNLATIAAQFSVITVSLSTVVAQLMSFRWRNLTFSG
jgi:hypothetical protein